MTPDEVRAFIAVARSEGVRRLVVVGQLELELYPAQPASAAAEAEAADPKQQALDQLEMLYRSAGGVPEAIKERLGLA